MSDRREELLALTSRQVEGKLAEADHARLNELLSNDDELIDLYTDYLCLHGQLTWDAGQSLGLNTVPMAGAVVPPPRDERHGRGKRRWAAATTATLMLLLGWWMLATTPEPPEQVVEAPVTPVDHSAPRNNVVRPPEQAGGNVDMKPLELAHHAQNPTDRNDTPTVEAAPSVVVQTNLPETFPDAMVVDKVDELIRKSWQEYGVTPASVAVDAEWVRRSYLTVAGRIPTLDESQQFLSNSNPRKRLALLDSLIESPEQSDHMATIWTNLLIGRTERRGVNRDMLFDFLADSFQRNESWIDTVSELITATGRNDENGATNFLLAHLNNEATPATAVTARLFLGEQISCVQCHDHPFSKGVRQEDYWALNAFFKDTVRVTVPESDVSGDSKYLACRLVDHTQVERITHFETRSGEQKAVLPKYDDRVLADDSVKNRRQNLAELLASDSHSKIARSMVNRMWAHFFGFGFTNPVDDMGPHAIVSHPQVLDLLTEAFVKSGYDVRRLIRWIATTEAWQLAGESTDSVDVPEHGETPLFSRMYTRRMTPEQVYESVRVAIRSSSGQPLNHTSESQEHRRTWVRQFARAYETDENDESVNFEGTIAQAMVMMNGEEVDSAIRQSTEVITQMANGRVSDVSLLERVAMAILTREPTSPEKKAFRVHHSKLTQQQQSATGGLPQALEDMMWAYLNSSEFVLIH